MAKLKNVCYHNISFLLLQLPSILSSSTKKFISHSFYDSAKLKAVVSGKPRRQLIRDAAAQLLATGIGLYSSVMTKKDLDFENLVSHFLMNQFEIF